jgi:hypothetical protein
MDEDQLFLRPCKLPPAGISEHLLDGDNYPPARGMVPDALGGRAEFKPAHLAALQQLGANQ